MEGETIDHFIGQCLKWAQQQRGCFNSFYLSVTKTVDTVPLHQIIRYKIQKSALTVNDKVSEGLKRIMTHHLTIPGQAESSTCLTWCHPSGT